MVPLELSAVNDGAVPYRTVCSMPSEYGLSFRFRSESAVGECS
jgi:hypothetical protein